MKIAQIIKSVIPKIAISQPLFHDSADLERAHIFFWNPRIKVVKECLYISQNRTFEMLDIIKQGSVWSVCFPFKIIWMDWLIQIYQSKHDYPEKYIFVKLLYGTNKCASGRRILLVRNLNSIDIFYLVWKNVMFLLFDYFFLFKLTPYWKFDSSFEANLNERFYFHKMLKQ